MRKIIIALSAFAAIGLAAPVSSASAETTVIKHEGGERHMDRDRRDVKKVVIKRGHSDEAHERNRERKVVIKHRDGDHDGRRTTIIKKGDGDRD